MMKCLLRHSLFGVLLFDFSSEKGGPMKKAMLLILFLLPALCLAAEPVKVKVQKASLFSQPNFLSRTVATLQFGDQLEMEEVIKDWAKVKFGQQRGYVHQSALTSTKVDLKTMMFSSSGSSEASQDEVALAGKGFTPEVEKNYGKAHPEMNYALVDEIERFSVDPNSLRSFIQKGGLKVSEGQR
jgi:hypothetical protein